MSATYTQCGGRTETDASRRGNRDGVWCSAQSYDGSVITHLRYYGDDEKPSIRIETSSDSSSSGTTRFDGSIDELEMCFEMWKDYLNRLNDKNNINYTRTYEYERTEQ